MGIKIINLVGHKFGRLMVIKMAEPHIFPNGDKSVQWLCQCDCGKEIIVIGDSLKSGNTASCGCYRNEKTRETHFINLEGQRFGKLLVIKLSHINKKGSFWKCLCDCGNENIIKSGNLRNGHTKSCGCQKESLIATNLKQYFIENYNAITEYKILKNPKTGYHLSYDIFIPIQNIFIEINGIQHYINDGYFGRTNDSFDKSKKRDEIKKKYARQNGIYIEIDLRKIKTVEDAIEYIEKRI